MQKGFGRPKHEKLKKVQSNAIEILANFSSNFDNFDGIKPLRNYAIFAMTDDGDNVGPKPVGVLQVFNKLDGISIDKDEIERLKQVARLFGALTQKA